MVSQKYITVRGIIDYRIRGFELLEFVRKGLQPYDDLGESIPPPNLPILKSNIQNLQKELAKREKDLEYYTQFHQGLLEKGEDHPAVEFDSKAKKQLAEHISIYGEGISGESISKMLDESSKSKILNKVINEVESKTREIKKKISLLNDDIATLTKEITPLEEGLWKNYEPNSREEKQTAISILIDAFYETEDVQKYIHPDISSENRDEGSVDERTTNPDRKHLAQKGEVEDVIRKAKPEIEVIYDFMKKEVGFSGQIVDHETKLKEAAENILAKQEDDFKLIKARYLQDIKIYTFNPGQAKRDIIGALLRKIVEEETGEDIGGQKLFEWYKKLTKNDD